MFDYKETIYEKLIDKVNDILIEAHKSGDILKSDMLIFHPSYTGDTLDSFLVDDKLKMAA
jgi:hypothetical protein